MYLYSYILFLDDTKKIDIKTILPEGIDGCLCGMRMQIEDNEGIK